MVEPRPYDYLYYDDLEKPLYDFLYQKQKNTEIVLLPESYPEFIRFSFYDVDDTSYGSVDCTLIFSECNGDYCEGKFYFNVTESVLQNWDKFLKMMGNIIHFEMTPMAMKSQKEFLSLLIEALKIHLLKCVFCDIIERIG